MSTLLSFLFLRNVINVLRLLHLVLVVKGKRGEGRILDILKPVKNGELEFVALFGEAYKFGNETFVWALVIHYYFCNDNSY